MTKKSHLTEVQPSTLVLTAPSARKAARQWFTGTSTKSLALWRNTYRLTHCEDLPNLKEHNHVFGSAFACGIRNLIIARGAA